MEEKMSKSMGARVRIFNWNVSKIKRTMTTNQRNIVRKYRSVCVKKEQVFRAVYHLQQGLMNGKKWKFT